MAYRRTHMASGCCTSTLHLSLPTVHCRRRRQATPQNSVPVILFFRTLVKSCDKFPGIRVPLFSTRSIIDLVARLVGLGCPEAPPNPGSCPDFWHVATRLHQDLTFRHTTPRFPEVLSGLVAQQP